MLAEDKGQKGDVPMVWGPWSSFVLIHRNKSLCHEEEGGG